MKETKKMMDIIQKQYREANDQCKYEHSLRMLKKDIKDIIFVVSLASNVVLFLLMVLALYI